MSDGSDVVCVVVGAPVGYPIFQRCMSSIVYLQRSPMDIPVPEGTAAETDAGQFGREGVTANNAITVSRQPPGNSAQKLSPAAKETPAPGAPAPRSFYSKIHWHTNRRDAETSY